MVQNWRSNLEDLRKEFKDASNSYLKLFHARLVGSRIGTSVWRQILGEKSFLNFSDRPINESRCDQTCLYADSVGDSVMLENARTRFVELAKRTRDCLSEVPEEFLRMVDPHAGRLGDGPKGWLDFVYHLAGGFDKPFRADQEKLFNVPDGSGNTFVRVPAIIVKHSPESFLTYARLASRLNTSTSRCSPPTLVRALPLRSKKCCGGRRLPTKV